MKKIIIFTILLLILLIPSADAKLPFIVRVVYFEPIDAPEMPDGIEELMREVQDFYRSEMERHGYGAKTFRLETDRQGDPIVHIVNGKKKSNTYTSYQALEPELPRELRNENNIHVFFMGGMRFVKPGGVLGVGVALAGGVCGGNARIAAVGEGFRLSVVAHELGHTFGLYHNIRRGNFLMGHGTKELDDYEARWLDKHHYFNSVHEINAVPRVIRAHQTEHIAIKEKGVNFQERDGVRFKIDVQSHNTLHQALLYRDSDLGFLGWRKLRGNNGSFEIDAFRSDVLRDNIAYLQVMDILGNYTIDTVRYTLPKLPQPKEEKEEEVLQDASVSSKHKLTVLWGSLKSR